MTAKDLHGTEGCTPLLLWGQGEILLQLDGIRPLLACWNNKTDPAQIRLQAYLDDLAAAIGPLPEDRGPLFLHLEVDVGDPKRLVQHHDLENYLYPIIQRLGWHRFCLAT